MEEVNTGDLTFTLDLSKPLWGQVLHQIRGAVARSDLQPGDKIPSLRDLAQQLKINPNTVMRAYQELERDGLTETRRGQGTFITSSQQKISDVKKLLAGEAAKEFMLAMKTLGVSKKDACTLLEEAKWS